MDSSVVQTNTLGASKKACIGYLLLLIVGLTIGFYAGRQSIKESASTASIVLSNLDNISPTISQYTPIPTITTQPTPIISYVAGNEEIKDDVLNIKLKIPSSYVASIDTDHTIGIYNNIEDAKHDMPPRFQAKIIIFSTRKEYAEQFFNNPIGYKQKQCADGGYTRKVITQIQKAYPIVLTETLLEADEVGIQCDLGGNQSYFILISDHYIQAMLRYPNIRTRPEQKELDLFTTIVRSIEPLR